MKYLWNLAFQLNFRKKALQYSIIPEDLLLKSFKRGTENDLLKFMDSNIG